MSAAEIIARGGVSLLEDSAVAVVLERCSSLRGLICSRAADGALRDCRKSRKWRPRRRRRHSLRARHSSRVALRRRSGLLVR